MTREAILLAVGQTNVSRVLVSSSSIILLPGMVILFCCSCRFKWDSHGAVLDGTASAYPARSAESTLLFNG